MRDMQAERLRYSRQRFVYLNAGETHAFRLRDGGERKIRLESVAEHEDSVIGLVRRAEVIVDVDGRRLELTSAPYVLPTQVDGLRIQVDATSGRLEMPKRVQLSLWDASDPIVDTQLFRFPLPGYRLFSHGTQAYGEPVHLGHGDGDPEGQRFHHDYGVDLAGFEGRQKVVSAIEGTVVRAQRDEGTLCIEDDRGLILVYGHLDSILSDVREGAKVERGQWVGMLGKRGGSGDFSHLHVGVYVSRADMLVDRMSRNLNLYPWLVAAYLDSRGPELHAVARPHDTARTGETVVLDGRNSLSSEAGIVSWEWVFHDGSRVTGPRAERSYDRPGCYSAALWVEDARGAKDVDFCTVRVFSRSGPEGAIPTIFATFEPTADIRVGQPVHFRFWPQGRKIDSLQVDFGDGTVIAHLAPSLATAHRFRAPGIHVVTASATWAGLPVTQKLAVVVEE